MLKMNTAKDDAVNHGYGHKIVKRIVEKYNGYVHYTIVENEFVAEVMLELKRGGVMNKQLNFAVCDDDEIVCEAICEKISKIVTSCGISVSCDKYVSPVSLYNNIKNGERIYDALFLDIDMPKLDGWTWQKRLEKEKIRWILFLCRTEKIRFLKRSPSDRSVLSAKIILRTI